MEVARQPKKNPFIDNPPLPGKIWFLVSLVSRHTTRQRGDVDGFKVHDVCDTLEEAEVLAQKYRRIDPDFDVFVQAVGKWIPWVSDPLKAKDVQYCKDQLSELLSEKRQQHQIATKGFGKKVKDIMEDNANGIQRKRKTKVEPAVAVWFKIRQLEEYIKARKNELEPLLELFHTRYSKEERKEAKLVDLPLSKPAPMHFNAMSGMEDEDEEEEEEKAAENGEELTDEQYQQYLTENP